MPTRETLQRFIAPVPPIEHQKAVHGGPCDNELTVEALAEVGFAELIGKRNPAANHDTCTDIQISHYRIVDRTCGVVEEDIHACGAGFLHGRREIDGLLVGSDRAGKIARSIQRPRLGKDEPPGIGVLFGGEPASGPRPVVPRARTLKTASGLLYDVLAGVYADLGFDALGDEVFRDLVIARVVEPTSLLDVDRVLAEMGRVSASLSTRGPTSARLPKTARGSRTTSPRSKPCGAMRSPGGSRPSATHSFA